MKIQKAFVLLLILSTSFLSFPESSKGQTATKPEFPATRAGERALAFVKALETGKGDLLELFFKENFSPEFQQTRKPSEFASRMLELRRELERIKVEKVESFSKKTIVMYVRGSENRIFKVELLFGPEPESFIQGLLVDEASPEDLEGPLPPMSLKDALIKLETEINEAVSADIFSGVVLLNLNGKTIFHKAWGLASKAFGTPNNPDTKFNLGSINKIFTKMAAGQLAEKGIISFDDKLGKWLPEYPNAAARDKVTIRHLIEMKSGIGDFFGEKFRQTPKNFFRNNADFLPMFADLPLAFEPGTKEAYSNGGYIVLGEIIARASGLDYYDYIKKHIFEPANMINADYYQADVPVQNLAEGYTRNPGEGDRTGSERFNNIYTRPARGSAAGGGYATASDLLNFARALTSYKLLSPDYTAWLLTNVDPKLADASAVREKPRRLGGLSLAGGAPGINAVLEIDPENERIIIVLANYDPPAAREIARKARRFLTAGQNN